MTTYKLNNVNFPKNPTDRNWEFDQIYIRGDSRPAQSGYARFPMQFGPLTYAEFAFFHGQAMTGTFHTFYGPSFDYTSMRYYSGCTFVEIPTATKSIDEGFLYNVRVVLRVPY